MSMRCIRHGELDPIKEPELSCKICCKLFVTAIKERQQAKAQKSKGIISRWLDDRSKVDVNESRAAVNAEPLA